MTTRVLFVQGAGEGAHDRWDDKLVASLEHELGPGYAVRYPRMPHEDDPQEIAWKTALFGEFEALKDGAILVGHSVGGTVLIHALAERPPRYQLGGIFLIAAPFIGGRLPAGGPIFLYHGVDDEIVPIAHVHLYAKAMPHAVVRTFDGRDHQLDNDLSEVARDIRSLIEM